MAHHDYLRTKYIFNKVIFQPCLTAFLIYATKLHKLKRLSDRLFTVVKHRIKFGA